MRFVTTVVLSLSITGTALAQQPLRDCIDDRSPPDYLDSVDPQELQWARNTLGNDDFNSLFPQIAGLTTDPDNRPRLSRKFTRLVLLQPESAFQIGKLVRESVAGSYERIALVGALAEGGTVEAQCQLAKIAEGKDFEQSLRETVIISMNSIAHPTADTMARVERLSQAQDDSDVVMMARLLLQNLRDAAK